jgi:hypothetical protein
MDMVSLLALNKVLKDVFTSFNAIFKESEVLEKVLVEGLFACATGLPC